MKLFDVINPATGDLVGTCPDNTFEDLNKAVADANAAFKEWSKVSDEVRVNALNKMADLLEENQSILSRLLTLEQGKTLKGLGSEFELQGCINWLRATAGMSLPAKELEKSDVRHAHLYRHPVGVVASIVPWNWPLLIAIWHLAPAVRVGCTIVIKPASNTPLSLILMVKILNAALPAGVLNVVTGRVGYELPSHAGISKIVFTGSTAVGKKVMAQAAPSLKRITLELGGNDAGLVLPDANVAKIAEGVFWGAFINMGQTCAALKRLYVHDSIYDEMCDALVELASKMPMGNGLDENNVLGPLQNKDQKLYIMELVEDARASGGKVLCGGRPVDGPGYFYPVTLISNVQNGHRIVDEEQFGPVLPIIKYSDIGQAIAEANSLEFGLGGSVWSNDIEKAREVALQLECGTVWINGHGEVLPHVPFGGIKQSGIGVEFGVEGLEEYTTIQSMHIPAI